MTNAIIYATGRSPGKATHWQRHCDRLIGVVVWCELLAIAEGLPVTQVGYSKLYTDEVLHLHLDLQPPESSFALRRPTLNATDPRALVDYAMLRVRRGS